MKTAPPPLATLVPAILLASAGFVLHAEIVISEFQASNSKTIDDGDGSSSDWIELHNKGDAPASTDGLFLTDNKDDPTKYPLPDRTLEPGGFLIVFASGRDSADYIDGDNHPHTNFSLSRSGEYLALIASDGTTVLQDFGTVYPAQRRDISYGLKSSSEKEHRYFDRPSPGGSNGSGKPGYVADIQFSVQRGFHNNEFSLELSSSTENVEIYYTLDGRAPDPGTVFTPPTGTVYEGPVSIDTTSVVRAIGLRPGWITSPIETHTYLFLDDVIRQPSAPEGWPTDWGDNDSEVGRVAADYEMDPRVVDDENQTHSIMEALLDIPSLSVVMPQDGFLTPDNAQGRGEGIYSNPKERGEDWVRVSSLEWMYPDGRESFRATAGVRMQGNSSRRPKRMQKHQFRIDFSSDYGDSSLDHPAIPGSPVESFNKLVLRACFTDSWGLVSWSESRYRPDDSQYIRDVWMKYSGLDMDQPAARSTFVHLYINGLYWGIYNLSERIDAAFAADNLGGEREDWDIIFDEELLRTGQRSSWTALQNLGNQAEQQDVYMQLLGKNPDGSDNPDYPVYLDPVNFADYMLLHFHAHAEDWPHHNYYACYNRTKRDGYQFLTWDQEIVLDKPSHAQVANRSNGPGRLFHNLMQADDFRVLFADRVFYQLFEEALRVEESQERYRRIAGWIDKAVVAESARWGDVASTTPYADRARKSFYTRDDDWVPERDEIIDEYIPSLTDITLQNLRNANLIPDFAPPVVDVPDVFVDPGTEVKLWDSESSIFSRRKIVYTTNGEDPRLPGGDIHPGAAESTTTVNLTIDSPALLKARLLFDDEWSALLTKRYSVHQAPTFENLAITEIHYNPRSPDANEIAAGHTDRDDFEFLELTNLSDVMIDLFGLTFRRGAEFEFSAADGSPALPLEPQGKIYVTNNSEAFQMRYGDRGPLLVAGELKDGTGLANNGETITLVTADGEEIASLQYDDDSPWPESADGDGYSLELTSTEGADSSERYLRGHWAASASIDGSVGTPSSSTGFAEWLDNLGNPDPLARNPEGQIYLVRYAQGLDLLTGDNTPDVGVELTSGSPNALRYVQRAALSDVTLTLEKSTDLNVWETVEPGQLTEEPLGKGVVRKSLDISSSTALFFRLRARK